MNLNGLNIESKAVLAPMAGFCDIVLRKVADDFGAGFTEKINFVLLLTNIKCSVNM